MATTYPSTHYACPCSDLTSAPIPPTNRRASFQPTTIQLSDEQAFNPHSRRANYALYPLDHLLYCDECDAIRCARCSVEEVLYTYCPSCLFEVPSSQVKGDGNRCSRSCYNCPSCTSQLAVTQFTSPRVEEDGLLKPTPDATPSGSETYILQCHYCDWSSLEIDVQFNKATKITEQLSKLRKARTTTSSSDPTTNNTTSSHRRPSHEATFNNLQDFYKDQLGGSTANDQSNPYSSSPYNSSPANLARIMSLYGGLPYNALKKSREKPQPMREALTQSEGLRTYTPTADDADAAVIHRLQPLGWEGTTSKAQRFSSPMNNDARFTSELWPAATQLRTRRGKRCKICRQFLTRTEQKVGSMKYRIRLLAVNYIPRLSMRPLQQATSTTALAAAANPAFYLKAEMPEQELLTPHRTKQYVLTIRNPIFEPVRISLATPATTPGKVASRVTILCPSFTVGPAGELWDDALASSTSAEKSGGGGRSAAMASLTGSSAQESQTSGERQPEAGKVWEKGRNWTSVVVEIVPGSLQPAPSIVAKTDGGKEDYQEFEEDDDVLEVPVYVRAEWEVEVKPGEKNGGGEEKGVAGGIGGEKVRKELGYWVVLGVGRIAS